MDFGFGRARGWRSKDTAHRYNKKWPRVVRVAWLLKGEKVTKPITGLDRSGLSVLGGLMLRTAVISYMTK